MAPRKALGQGAKLGAWVEDRPLLPGLNAQSLIALKPARLHLHPGRSEISPHPWASCSWKPFSFLDRQAQAEEVGSIVEEEEVRIVGMIVVVGRKTTWSG